MGIDNSDSDILKIANSKDSLGTDTHMEFSSSGTDFLKTILANGSAGTSGQVLTSGGSGGTASWTTVSGGGGSNAWTTSGSDVYRSSGKVGIGKTNPTHVLDVNGTVNATSYEGDGSNLTGVTASAITSEASRTITISTIKAQGGSWDVRS